MSKQHTCEICNKRFIKHRVNQPSRFCSRECFIKYQRSDEAKAISRTKMLERRERYLKKHGVPLGFTSVNNPAKTPTARQKMSQFRKGKPLSKETRRRQSESLKKTLASPEMRRKWSEAATGRKSSLETRKKISKAHSGKYKNRSGLIAKLDKVYSWYIKESKSKDGMATCITCGKLDGAYNMDCGHYISRRFIALRYDERNTHIQCIRCNRFEQGNIDVYTIKMMQMYGNDVLLELNRIKNTTTKVYDTELEEKLQYYMSELSRLNPSKYPLWL